MTSTAATLVSAAGCALCEYRALLWRKSIRHEVPGETDQLLELLRLRWKQPPDSQLNDLYAIDQDR